MKKKTEPEVIERFSVFEYPDQTALFSFLAVCERTNKTVHFQNEDLTVPPHGDLVTKINLNLHMAVKNYPKVVENYVNYLFNLDKHTADHDDTIVKGYIENRKEPILKNSEN